ncbi:hypothetical protein FRACYDRAFT_241404 [Fragilariopsis cylindrus CCMP1102]|uniref:Uncharacterized protein n=1 Tax=Fragilariopsis cylindrus CCMP1102 TaxID=635003 RepID=A0A1E7F9L2_9STRA|nr:hypothetical protein FRACYDRAFT_241404 [Fragilariopsis cylindrus CCMP1102]|eukprot:OEU14847.1 hypothetical protein FRACYDRAFT_241404 [Fragilariopsis cylindrus CCMP1102]
MRTIKGRGSNKRRKIKDDSIGTISSNEHPSTIPQSVLRILANNGCVDVHDLGTLAQTNKSMRKVIRKDKKELFILAFQQTYGIPRHIQEKIGRRCLLKQLGKKTIRTQKPSFPQIPLPNLTEDDFMLTGELYFNNRNGNHRPRLVRGFCITGEKLSEFFEEDSWEIEHKFDDPINLSNAEIRQDDCTYWGGEPGYVSVGPSYESLKMLANCVNIRLVRFSDMKSCCIHNGTCRRPVLRTLPTLKPLDRSKSAKYIAKLGDINKLDFDVGTQAGFADLHSDRIHPPFQSTLRAAEIGMRFPYNYFFNVELELIATPERKIAIAGFSLQVHKEVNEDGDCHPFDETDEFPNNGVTIGHLLSELYCK